MDATVIFTLFIVISIVIAIAIGANDETMAPLYGSRILNMKQILILAAIFAISGAILLGEGVARSVGNNILLIDYETTNISQNAVVMTILISTAIWLIISSALGLPISSTHSTIGGIMGLGLLLGGGGGVNWGTILGMSMWWLLSPVVGFTVTYFVVKILQKHKIKYLNGFRNIVRIVRKNLLVFVFTLSRFQRNTWDAYHVKWASNLISAGR